MRELAANALDGGEGHAREPARGVCTPHAVLAEVLVGERGDAGRVEIEGGVGGGWGVEDVGGVGEGGRGENEVEESGLVREPS